MAKLNVSEINLQTLGRLTEGDARRLLEKLRWPHGTVCPHCGVIGDAKRMESDEETEHRLRDGVLNCRACRKPFTVTVGTIFEGSHIPLSKWLLGFYLFASSKKSMSAAQLQRQLGLGSYRTAWHMAHRIRHAMQNDPKPERLSGILEADETFVGGKIRNPRKRTGKKIGERLRAAHVTWKEKRVPVAVLVSRDGQARARALAKVSTEELRKFLRDNADARKATLNTDEGWHYTPLGKAFSGGHHTVNHGKGEYARGSVHSNTAESFHGLFKRSINGAWHHISREHIARYLDEQVFRWSNRKIDDGQRTLAALDRVGGVRLYYKRPTQPKPGGEGLVACG